MCFSEGLRDLLDLATRLLATEVDGGANAAVIAAVAEALKIPKRDVRIKSGLTSRRKVLNVQISDAESISVLRNQD